MNNSGFWQDVLRSGALLGLVMSLSMVAEQYIMGCSSMALPTASVVYFVEWCAVAVLFVVSLYRMAKRRAAATDPAEGFGFSQAFAYMLLVSLLTGVVVGVANMLFISAVGYESYVAGIIGRIDEMRSMVSSAGMAAGYNSMFEQMVSSLRSAEQPTIIDYVLSATNNYIIFGGIVALLTASMVRREPTHRINDEE